MASLKMINALLTYSLIVTIALSNTVNGNCLELPFPLVTITNKGVATITNKGVIMRTISIPTVDYSILIAKFTIA